MLRSVGPLRLAFTTLAVTAALSVLAATVALTSAALAAYHTCPKLTNAQISRVLGFKVVSLTVHPGAGFVGCFYTLRRSASVSLAVYRGSGELAKLKATADENLGTLDMDADQSGSPCTPAWGQCQGTKHAAGEAPLVGLGQTAVAFPGADTAGAFVIFVSHNETFNLGSSGPYRPSSGYPGGPTEPQLIAFARLLLRNHFSLSG